MIVCLVEKRGVPPPGGAFARSESAMLFFDGREWVVASCLLGSPSRECRCRGPLLEIVLVCELLPVTYHSVVCANFLLFFLWRRIFPFPLSTALCSRNLVRSCPRRSSPARPVTDGAHPNKRDTETHPPNHGAPPTGGPGCLCALR